MLNLFFPQLCSGCDRRLFDNQRVLCTYCLNNLPLTHQKTAQNDQISRLCYGRFELKNSFSLLNFQKKGLSQQLLHNLKYKGQQQIGQFFGEYLGQRILETLDQLPFDAIVIVPVSPKTYRSRGYNQVTRFAQALSKTLNVPIAHKILIKKNGRSSSVFLSRWARLAKPSQFCLNRRVNTASYKHLLLVDDLITTGATAEACAKELLKIPTISLSFASIAVV
jgi:ComF family protein